MTPSEQQTKLDERTVKIIKAKNGFSVRAYPEFMVFNRFEDMVKFLDEHFKKENPKT